MSTWFLQFPYGQPVLVPNLPVYRIGDVVVITLTGSRRVFIVDKVIHSMVLKQNRAPSTGQIVTEENTIVILRDATKEELEASAAWPI